MTRDYSVPAIHRAVQVIEILSASHTGFSLAEISRQTTIPKSSLFRILAALEQHSIVIQDHERKIFKLGMKLLDWGNAALEKVDLKSIVHPHLTRMAQETRESYYLAVLDSHEVIIIDRADTAEIWQMVARLGGRSPVHATASGQVLIADVPPEMFDRIIERSGLKRFTPKTITSVTRLKKRLDEVKRLGYSIADAEYKSDLCAVSVPIHDHHGKVVAALMTAIASERKRKNEVVARIIDILKKEASIISPCHRICGDGRMTSTAGIPLPLAIVSDEIAPDFREAIKHGLLWGITQYEIRCLNSGRIPDVDVNEWDDLLRAVGQHGLTVTALSPGIFKHSLSKSVELENEVVDVLPRTIAMARQCGASLIIVFGFKREDHEPASNHALAVDYLRRAAATAARGGDHHRDRE